MNLNKNQNLNKINQIILYSQNYSAHKKMLNQMKYCIDASSPQRNSYNIKLNNQHIKYKHAVKRLKDEQINQSNRRLTQTLIKVSKPVSKGKVILQNQKSITSRSFWNLKTAKQRQRSKQKKQIHQQNLKMQERISKSRSKQNFGRQSYYKQKAQTQRDLNIRGSYSQRSQSVLENLVYNDLKIQRNDIPFLPQLSGRYKMINQKNSKKQRINTQNKKCYKINFQRENLSFQKQMNFKL